jgi:hypothetical protein
MATEYISDLAARLFNQTELEVDGFPIEDAVREACVWASVDGNMEMYLPFVEACAQPGGSYDPNECPRPADDEIIACLYKLAGESRVITNEKLGWVAAQSRRAYGPIKPKLFSERLAEHRADLIQEMTDLEGNVPVDILENLRQSLDSLSRFHARVVEEEAQPDFVPYHPLDRLQGGVEQ